MKCIITLGEKKNVKTWKRGSILIADVILGVNIDTNIWIRKLKENKVENIIVIDYECHGDLNIKEGVIYISPLNAISYLKQFDSINFYKSMYAYPGMNGKMSDLYKK